MYMSNICKTVTLRTRKIKGGEQLSFYLDYYPGYATKALVSTSMPSRRTSARRTTTTACARRPRPCAAVAMRVLSTSATTSSTRRR